MKGNLRTFGFTVLVSIFLIVSQSNLIALGNNSNSQKKYPVIYKNELRPAPKNAPVKKVDINSDGLYDMVATYPWGNSELYLNCGNDRYYPLIQSNTRLQVESTKSYSWLKISLSYVKMNWIFDASTLIDGQLYRPSFLPFESENDNQNESSIIKYDGSSYKLPYKYCKGLKIYAPRYQFEPKIQIVEKNIVQEISLIYLDLLKTRLKIDANNQSEYWFGNIYFTDLNRDAVLDAVLYYKEQFGSGAESYAGILLNDGDNYFVYAGNVELGRRGGILPRFRAKEISINGKRFIAIVIKRPDEKNVELYFYQSVLKKFFHITALSGQDKSTFIPLDKKQFEDIVNPPLFRNESSKFTKTNESAISTLIENYEKSLVNAINRNNFSLVAKYLTPRSNLYKSQKALVAKLYRKKTREKLVSYKVEAIKTTGQANVYQVYVTEKIGIKCSGKADFVIFKFRWVYTVVADGAKYGLSDIARWDGK